MKVGDSFKSWFDGGNLDGSSKVLSVEPYQGRYKEHFTHVLRLSSVNTRRGWLEQAVKIV